VILIRRWALRRLVFATAESFGKSIPSGRGLSYRQYLLRYARFTNKAALRALERSEDMAALRGRLQANSFALGDRIRKSLRLRSRSAIMAAARLLYRMIGVDFCGSSNGEVRVSSCFFSKYYTPSVCRLISALDQGLLAGLSGGGSLTFQCRLTEGHPYCKARFAFEDNKT
jgi:hypothetical protein